MQANRAIIQKVRGKYERGMRRPEPRLCFLPTEAVESAVDIAVHTADGIVPQIAAGIGFDIVAETAPRSQLEASLWYRCLEAPERKPAHQTEMLLS